MPGVPFLLVGAGVTGKRMLSDWYPAIRGTAGDMEVYVLEGTANGSSMLVLGGPTSLRAC